ncbi:hypothetical protein DIPPA_32485 [Diplonema papillatum]|nr:hypothetical protein DIPPA_32485 [Diplonema papillatum]
MADFVDDLPRMLLLPLCFLVSILLGLMAKQLFESPPRLAEPGDSIRLFPSSHSRDDFSPSHPQKAA